MTVTEKMSEAEKRDWKILLFPMSWVMGLFIIIPIYLSTIPKDSLGAMGPYNIPIITWVGVIIPFLISCFSPILVALLTVKAVPKAFE